MEVKKCERIPLLASQGPALAGTWPASSVVWVSREFDTLSFRHFHVLFLFLSLRYGADLCRSRLVNSSISANFTLTTLTVDRLWAVWKPHDYKQKAKSKTAVKISIVLGAFAIVASAPTLIIMRNTNGGCFGASLAPNNSFLAVFNWYLNVVAPVLLGVPFIAIVSLNVMIIYKLKEKKVKMTSCEIEVTVSLVAVSVTFFIFNLASFAAISGKKRFDDVSTYNVDVTNLLITLAVSMP